MRVVILPGLDGTGLMLREFARAAPEGWTVEIATYPLDLSGYDALVRFARQRLPQDEPYLLIAESFSGPIGIRLAATASNPPTALVLVASFARSQVPVHKEVLMAVQLLPKLGLAGRVAEPFVIGPNPPAWFRPAFATTLRRLPRRTLRCRLADILSVNEASRLAEISRPILYIRAARDRLVPRSAGHNVVANAPCARIIDIGGPHFVLQKRPRECWHVIQDFLLT